MLSKSDKATIAKIAAQAAIEAIKATGAKPVTIKAEAKAEASAPKVAEIVSALREIADNGRLYSVKVNGRTRLYYGAKGSENFESGPFGGRVRVWRR